MAEALKDMFNKKFYERLALEFNKADKNFHSEKFVKDVIKDLDKLELNQRLRNTTLTLKKYLPADYKKSVDIIKQVAPDFAKHYTAFIFPDFVGQYGHDNIDLSLETLKYLTQYGTSEFAIREFLKRDFNGTIKVMKKWAEDDNYHVRRLASEGCRPRLPWSYNLPEVMKNPELTLPILEKLKGDNELYVKKSVANHLNDFSRNHTDWMVSLLRSWDKNNIHTAWIIKHASRTLIKKGHAGSLALFGFENNPKILVENFKLKKPKIKLGDSLDFNFNIVSERSKPQKLVIDYAIHYAKKSGLQSRKIFKLKEIVILPETTVAITKAQSFKDFSTRQHYPGKHKIEILINGKVYCQKEFSLSI
jgi:3-methyladenine DNA glycosylase AlkC